MGSMRLEAGVRTGRGQFRRRPEFDSISRPGQVSGCHVFAGVVPFASLEPDRAEPSRQWRPIAPADFRREDVDVGAANRPAGEWNRRRRSAGAPTQFERSE